MSDAVCGWSHQAAVPIMRGLLLQDEPSNGVVECWGELSTEVRMPPGCPSSAIQHHETATAPRVLHDRPAHTAPRAPPVQKMSLVSELGAEEMFAIPMSIVEFVRPLVPPNLPPALTGRAKRLICESGIFTPWYKLVE
jgi:hypothetical protein